MAPAPAPATMAPLLRLTLLAALLDAAAGTCTSDEGFALGGRSINTAHAASYGACCDLCIQTAGCSYYSFETATGACELKKTAAGRAAAKGSWSGWAGTGPAPPPPSPPVAPGKWSAVHKSASCEQSSSAFVKGMGKIPLAACQAACVAEPKCGYICHADETDHACTLYGSCSEPALCGHTGWDTYQFGRPNAPAWNTTCKNGGPPRPGPSPSPTPAGPDSFDCKVRVFALEYASKIMDGADISAVQTSLGFGEGCAPPAPTAPLLGKGRRLVDTLPALAAPLTGGGATTLYIDSAKGKDSNAGTLAAPFKTLQKAQAAAVAGTTVFLRAGTFHLNTTWTLGPKASGTTWAAYENEEVIISGGVNLSGLKWTPAKSGPAGAMETSLPSSMGDAAAVPTTLFVNGVREIRAKFPNGDPLIPGGAGWSASASGALGSFEPTGVPLPNSVFVHDAAGRLLSSGASVGNKVYNFTVSPNAVPKMTGRGYDPTRADFHAYANHSAERFDTTWNNPFWNSQVSPGFSTKSLTTKHWANPASGIVHMYHSGMWGGWQYQVSSRAADPEGGDGIMFACKQLGGDGKRVTCPASDNKGADAQDLVIDGGFQECRGANIGSNKFYVENIAEELDVEREWFATGSTLRYFPATGVDLNSPKTSVIGAVLKNVIEVDGASDVTIRGLTITHTAPTFMDAYECPSGGDWSIHRGAAVFVEASSNVTLEGLTFDQPSGNAVMFSNEVMDSAIRKCSFKDVGDSAISMLGSTQQMIGMSKSKSGLFPTRNVIENNIVDVVGVYGKQTSAYFKAKSRENTVKNNVFMNGPRAGVNFNDGSAGGEVLEGNLIMNFVRETGDHGMFNSWDRQPIVHDDDAGEVALNPLTHQIHKNFIFNRNWLGSTNSGYSIDYDDGSSQYNATHNFLVYGAFKVRDGINRAHSHNIIYGKPADYQCDGYNSTTMEYNTIIGENGGEIAYGCVGKAFGPKGTYNSVKQNYNKYYGSGLNACGMSLAQLQAAGYDTESTLSANITTAEIISMAKDMLMGSSL